MIADIRQAARSLRRSWPVVLVVGGSLGVAISATATVFGVLNSLFERHLAVPRPSELVSVQPVSDGAAASLTYAQFVDFRASAGIRGLAAYRSEPANLGTTASAPTDLAWIDAVSGQYFETLGVHAAVGRALTPEDEATGADVAVISEQYWVRHYGGDSAVVGHALYINGAPFRIIGVMPPSFGGLFFAHSFTVAVPVSANTGFAPADIAQLSVGIIARLPRGSQRQKESALLQHAFASCCAQLVAATFRASRSSRMVRLLGPIPDDPPLTNVGSPIDTITRYPHIALIDASRGLTWGADLRNEYQRAAWITGAGAILLLLIACANVATVFATRSTRRRREFATRLALGASRTHIARQILSESGILVAVGLMLGLVGAELTTAYLVENLPRGSQSLATTISWRMDPALFVFSAAVCVVCTIACAIWPLRIASSNDVIRSMRGDDRVELFSQSISFASVLLVAQVALSVVLMAGALLFISTIRKLGRSDGGYGSSSVVLARIYFDSSASSGTGGEGEVEEARIISELSRLPGVRHVGIATAAPLLHDARLLLPVAGPSVSGSAPMLADINAISPGFLAAAGVSIRSGREFVASDGSTAEPVALVSSLFVRRHITVENPVGTILTIGGGVNHRAVRIVGIVGDAQYGDIHDQPTEMIYVPRAQVQLYGRQLVGGTAVLAANVSGDPASFVTTVRGAVSQVDRTLRVRNVTTVTELLDEALARERVAAFLGTVFGVVALGLVALGMYGIVAYEVSQRAMEVGIRLALGAPVREIARLFLGRTFRILSGGILVGTICAFVMVHVLAARSFGLSQFGPVAMVSATAGIIVLAALATAIPLRRATRVDPAIALRTE